MSEPFRTGAKHSAEMIVTKDMTVPGIADRCDCSTFPRGCG